MTRDELVAMVESYAKRSDVTTEIETMFIPQAEARIGRDVQARENEAVKTYTGSPDTDDRFFTMPDDAGRVRSLEAFFNNRAIALVSLDLMTITKRPTGGQPDAYAIRGDVIEVRPYTAGSDVTLYYWARPALPTGADTNPLLTRYPQVYRFAVLMELHDWERDLERWNQAAQMYREEVRLVNRQAGRETGNKPAMRRV